VDSFEKKLSWKNRGACAWLVVVYEKRRDRDGRTTVIVVRVVLRRSASTF
jgi:hypothetical protein